MTGDRVGGRRVQGEPGGPLGGQGQGDKDVPPAVLMIVDANTGKSRRLTSCDEVCGLLDRQAYGHPDIHFHRTHLLFRPQMGEAAGDHLLVDGVAGKQAGVPAELVEAGYRIRRDFGGVVGSVPPDQVLNQRCLIGR